MKKIAVFFGGVSPEHDVSVITGVLTLNALKKTEYDVVPIYIDKKGEWFTGENLFDLDNYKNLDVKKIIRVSLQYGDNTLYKKEKNKLKKLFSLSSAINCCHGGDGENGNLSGVIECSNIALCSPNALCSAIFMDKEKTKIALKGLGHKYLPCISITNLNVTEAQLTEYQYPLIVKPNTLGSSIGMKKVNSYNELLTAIKEALSFSSKVLIEKCLEDFIEINCACYKNANGDIVVSECERPFKSQDILSFSDKYKSGNKEFPANIPKKISDKIKSVTENVYKAFDFTGVIRIDYFVENEKVYVNEINTVPGSLAYYLFTSTLKEFSDMLKQLILTGEKEFVKKQNLKTDYQSGILTSFGSKSAKHLR